MNVLSLFDGMSCGRLALERAGIPVTNYYASEIDKYAIQVSKANWPDIQHIGSVTTVEEYMLPDIDLLIGGSPCQGFSFAGKQLNFDDPRSKLFFEFVRLLKECKPKYFLLENVKMKKEYQAVISEALGVEPVEINSALVSAQNRRRLYWTNIPYFGLPNDKFIYLKDILETSGTGVIKNEYEYEQRTAKAMCLDASYYKGADNHGQRTIIEEKALTLTAGYRFAPSLKEYLTDRKKQMIFVGLADDIRGHKATRRIYSEEGKAPTLTSCEGVHRQPKVEIRQLNPSTESGGVQPYMQNRVYDPDYKSPALTLECGRLNIAEPDTFYPASIVGRRLNAEGKRDDYNPDTPVIQCLQVKHNPDETGCLTTVDKDNVITSMPPGRYEDVYNQPAIHYRKLTPVECERLQTVPDGYTSAVSNTQRYKMLGNGWNIDTIVHLFRPLAFIDIW